jgi:hypothetical protein
VSELPLETNEHREHAEHAAHAHDPFVTRVSITIAVLAVVTALIGSLEITENGGAITASSRAVLAQDRATDSWGAFQSASLKKHMYDLAAGAADPARAAALKGQSAKYVKDQAGYGDAAKRQEDNRDRALEDSERHEHRHHRLTIAAALLQIGIAISTVAIVTGRRSFWWGSLLLGVVGALLGASAYIG